MRVSIALLVAALALPLNAGIAHANGYCNEWSCISSTPGLGSQQRGQGGQQRRGPQWQQQGQRFQQWSPGPQGWDGSVPQGFAVQHMLHTKTQWWCKNYPGLPPECSYDVFQWID